MLALKEPIKGDVRRGRETSASLIWKFSIYVHTHPCLNCIIENSLFSDLVWFPWFLRTDPTPIYPPPHLPIYPPTPMDVVHLSGICVLSSVRWLLRLKAGFISIRDWYLTFQVLSTKRSMKSHECSAAVATVFTLEILLARRIVWNSSSTAGSASFIVRWLHLCGKT